MSFELVAVLPEPPGGPVKRRRGQDGEEILELNADVIQCIELLEDVKLAYDMPNYAKYKQASDIIRSMPNMKEEADEWFWENNAYKVDYEKSYGYDEMATFARILCDLEYIKNAPKNDGYGDDTLSYEDRIRLFRILWEKKIDRIINYRYDKDFETDRRSSVNYKVPSPADVNYGAPDLFQHMVDFKGIQTKGEELLFERIRFFNQNFIQRIHDGYDDNYMRDIYLSVLQPLTETEDGSEWLQENGKDFFCLMLSRALGHENDLIKETAQSVVKIMREKLYKPEWIKEANEWEDDLSGDNVYNLDIPEPKQRYNIYHGQMQYIVNDYTYLRAVSDYFFRLSTKGLPRFIGGRFFEQEIFFGRLRRQEYDAEEKSNKAVRDKYLAHYNRLGRHINTDFLNSQKIIEL